MLVLTQVPADRLSARTAETVARAAERQVTSRHVDLETARAQVAQVVEREDSAFLDVTDAGSVVGSVWLGSDGDELLVRDLVLEDAGAAADLVAPLTEQARARGARMVGIGVQPGESAHRALAELPGFSVRATNMVLDLSGAVDDSGPLVLEPMDEQEFRAFMEGEVEGFAEELIAAGTEPEIARERSRTLNDELLPAGLASPGMEFLSARVDGETVGGLWLSTGETMAFVYNIVVDPEHRRRGHGAAIMNAAARHCREAGHPVLGLNVFAHNPGARALYDKLGYRVTQDYAALDLDDAG